MKVYSPNDLAELFYLKPSTIRKYSKLLEEHGYHIQRNDNNQRWYNDNDVIALRKFISYKHDGDMTLKQSAEAVSLWSKGGDVADTQTDTRVAEERDDENITELRALLKNQNELLQKQNEDIELLKNRLDHQSSILQQYIQQDKQLKDSTNKHQEESLEMQKERKKGFFQRWFGI